ncbi:hypothetical protein [Burkholderia phage BCSR5]|nr:hypothetical protein [Burkholderia phage BCSR5]
MVDRKIVHLQVGDDNWTPTVEELMSIVEMFQSTELDKGTDAALSAVVATRNAVQPTVIELKDGEELVPVAVPISLSQAVAARVLGDLIANKVTVQGDASPDFHSGVHYAMEMVRKNITRIVYEYTSGQQPDAENECDPGEFDSVDLEPDVDR